MSIDAPALCLQWSTAREQLSQAIDAFEAACNALATPGIRAGAILESAQPDFLLSVQTDLPLLTQEAKRAFGFTNTMKKLRNDFTMLVPINCLPSELLSYIFIISIHTSRANRLHRERGKRLIDFVNIISSVSTYWRYVSLGTPLLWADIVLTRPEGLNHAALWLERSSSCPFNLFSCPPDRFPLNRTYPWV